MEEHCGIPYKDQGESKSKDEASEVQHVQSRQSLKEAIQLYHLILKRPYTKWPMGVVSTRAGTKKKEAATVGKR